VKEIPNRVAESAKKKKKGNKWKNLYQDRNTG
jgi:hypothetical protein